MIYYLVINYFSTTGYSDCFQNFFSAAKNKTVKTSFNTCRFFLSLWIMPPTNGTGLSKDANQALRHTLPEREEMAEGSQNLHHYLQKQTFQNPSIWGGLCS